MGTVRPTLRSMCGRYASDIAIDDLMAFFDASPGTAYDWAGLFSVAPSDPAPVVRERLLDDELHREVDYARWGLRPGWAKDSGPRPINARLETVATSGMFRSAFTSQRCLVPMTGYYEWETTPSGKQPHYIHADGPLAAAGLYAARKDPASGEWALTYTVITREARDASGEIHDRMPVFVLPDLWGEWLSPDALADKETMTDRLTASSDEVAQTMTTHRVDRRVNSTQKADPTDPSLVESID